MSLNSIFNSLWNMDLTIIVYFILGTFSLLLLIAAFTIFFEYLQQKIFEKFNNLSELKKSIIESIIAITLIILGTVIFIFALSILGF